MECVGTILVIIGLGLPILALSVMSIVATVGLIRELWRD